MDRKVKLFSWQWWDLLVWKLMIFQSDAEQSCYWTCWSLGWDAQTKEYSLPKQNFYGVRLSSKVVRGYRPPHKLHYLAINIMGIVLTPQVEFQADDKILSLHANYLLTYANRVRHLAISSHSWARTKPWSSIVETSNLAVAFLHKISIEYSKKSVIHIYYFIKWQDATQSFIPCSGPRAYE